MSDLLNRCRGYKGSTYSRDPHDVALGTVAFYARKNQCSECYGAYAADWRAKRTNGATVLDPSSSNGRALPPILNGAAQLRAFATKAGYDTVVAAVAEHTVFLHPDTVRQTDGKPLFPVIRNREMAMRGTIGADADGVHVLLDDNTSPTLAFLWAAGRTKGPDVQFNHIWDRSQDVSCYTALWNLCATPAFLAKTTDGSHFREVRDALRYHAFKLYGFRPATEPDPSPPANYDRLRWAPHPEPVLDLEGLFRDRLRRSPRSRPALVAKTIGWLFSDGPDTSIG